MYMTTTTTLKECRTCKESKALEDFHRHSRSADGHQPRCKECVSAYMRDYHIRNAEALRAKTRAWAKANPERKRAGDAKVSTRLTQKRRDKRSVYKEALDRICPACLSPVPVSKNLLSKYCSSKCESQTSKRIFKANRRAKEYGAEGVLIPADWAGIVRRQNGFCAICNQKAIARLDHIVAFILGGSNLVENIQGICDDCDISKSRIENTLARNLRQLSVA